MYSIIAHVVIWWYGTAMSEQITSEPTDVDREFYDFQAVELHNTIDATIDHLPHVHACFCFANSTAITS
ncbi:MAG TPA: hypothetical protein VIJ25_12895, partial [Methylococcales bacterium]